MRRVPTMALVWAFGLVQAGHLVLNGRYMFAEGLEAFPGPREGWSDQAVDLMRGLAVADWIVAAGSIAFMWGWRGDRPWARTLGLVTTSASVFSVVAFTIGIVAVGAWSESPVVYTAMVAVFAPAFLLLPRLAR